jgi:hypothetical protein
MRIKDLAIQLRCRFNVNRQYVGAGFRETVEIVFRIHDHQMHVDRHLREFAARFDDLRAERQIRHEDAVHDIDVQPVGAACFEHRDVVLQSRKIR